MISQLMRYACFSALLVLRQPGLAQQVSQLTPHVEVIQGAVNGVLIESGGRRLAIYGDPRQDPPQVDTLLFTHHRRDVVWAGRKLVERGAKAVGPAQEVDLFTNVEAFWSQFLKERFHDYEQQTTKILVRSLPSVKTVREGDTIDWEGPAIRVLETPGYTRGAVTYVVEIDNQKIAFTGDLIYGDGQVLDWYSLQDGIPELKVAGYHGYGARAAQLIQSLEKVAKTEPDLLIPARGPIIRNARPAITQLIANIRELYANYLSINAYRWYYPDRTEGMATRILDSSSRVDWMALAERPADRPPDWIIPIRNARLILSEDGSGFLVDCGSQAIIQEIGTLRDSGKLRSLDGIFVTHYHDDHTDQVASLARQFQSPVYVTRELEDVLKRPWAYRLPAMTSNPIVGLTAVNDGTRLKWKEFELIFYYFPGQTLYHDALLARKSSGEEFLFVGDSFTPTGIDDYCPQNRDFLHPRTGYFYCLNFLEKLNPKTWLINQHVLPPFRFSQSQLDLMTETLQRRVDLLARLFPWDDPNYGLDEGWVRFYPYGQSIKPGETARLSLKIWNHSSQTRKARARLNAPSGWNVATQAGEVQILPKREGRVEFNIRIPEGAEAGTQVITADLFYGPWELRQWAETLLVVEP